MRISLFGPSLLALSLSACNVSFSSESNSAEAEPRAAAPKGEARWTGETAKQLRDAIGARAAHGLDRMPFDVGGSGVDTAALNRAALAYAGALARGATDPKKLHEIYTVPRPEPELEQGLRAALAAGDVRGWLEGLAPQDASYKKLSAAYLALRREPDRGTPVVPPPPEPLKPGISDPRVPLIARQLVASDYLAAEQAQGNRYTPAMAAAVKRLQADYGIKPDGVIGADALAILNLDDADRARAIAVAMERLRWLERDPPKTRIDVNIAAARLSYWKDGAIADTRRAVVGEPDNETPQLGSPIFRLVANPTWTVPKGIAAEEIAPKGAGYLRANNMRYEDGWIVQQPGPKNSLGLVKFDMQNEHAIYLHDTPAKPLFAEVERHRSHGCVRMEDALGFAEMLARDGGVTDEWRQARATGEETFVKLPRQIPVRLLYHSVLFDEAGEPVVRNDPYGWNEPVAAALGFQGGAGARVQPRHVDVGP